MSPTWETSSDWDAGQSESGVHHEQPAGTDWAASDQVEMGYPSTDQGGTSLEAYVPCDESSGPMADVSANGYSLTLSGASPGATGVLGTTAVSYDGTDDFAEMTGTGANVAKFSALVWVKLVGSHDDWARIIQVGGSESSGPTNGWDIEWQGSDNSIKTRGYENGDGTDGHLSNTTLAQDTWYCLITKNISDGRNNLAIYDASGTQLESQDKNMARGSTSTAPVYIAAGDGRYSNIVVDEVRIWTRELSDSEEQALASVV